MMTFLTYLFIAAFIMPVKGIKIMRDYSDAGSKVIGFVIFIMGIVLLCIFLN